MAVEHSGASGSTAQDLADALAQLDELLASQAYDDVQAADVAALRARVRRGLVSMRTDLEALSRLDADDVFRTNPVFATQRYQLITSLEQTKLDFEFDLAPALEKLASASIEQARRRPPVYTDGTGLNLEQILDSAERFVDASTRAVGVVSKAGALISALSLLAGLVPH
jgi:hypothetical protein